MFDQEIKIDELVAEDRHNLRERILEGIHFEFCEHLRLLELQENLLQNTREARNTVTRIRFGLKFFSTT